MVLIAIVYSRMPGSPFELAKFFSFTVIPSFIVSPIAGVFVDRWDKKRTMIVCDLLRGLIVLSIPLLFLRVNTPVPIYAAVFLIFAVSCFFLPARLAIIPDLVSTDKLLVANSLFTVTGMIGGIFWFVVSGLLIELSKVSGGLYLNSVVYFCSALAIVFISGKRHPYHRQTASIKLEEVIRKSLFEEIKDGLSYLKNHSQARFAFNVLFVLMAGVGAIYSVVIVFIQERMGSMTRDLGLLGLFLGGGFFVGSLLYGRLGHGMPKAKIVFGCLILSGIAIFSFTALLELTRSFLFASIAAMILGVAVAPIGITTNALIHEFVTENMRGRIFSSLGIVMNFAFLVFMLIGSKIAENVDRGLILYAVSLFYFIAGILGFMLRKND